MEKENNVKCKREECLYNKGFFSRIMSEKGVPPKQCPICKRYSTVKKLK